MPAFLLPVVVSWGISVESAFHSHTLKWVAPALLLALLLCSALNLAATCWHYGGRCDILAVRLLSLPRTPILRPVHLEKTITRLSSAALAAYSFFTLGALMTKKDQGKDSSFFFGVLRENSFTSAVQQQHSRHWSSSLLLCWHTQPSMLALSLTDLAAALPSFFTHNTKVHTEIQVRNNTARRIRTTRERKGAAFENRVSGVQHFSFCFFFFPCCFCCWFYTGVVRSLGFYSYSRYRDLDPPQHHSRPTTCGKIYIPTPMFFLVRSLAFKYIKNTLCLSIAHQSRLCGFPPSFFSASFTRKTHSLLRRHHFFKTLIFSAQ